MESTGQLYERAEEKSNRPEATKQKTLTSRIIRIEESVKPWLNNMARKQGHPHMEYAEEPAKDAPHEAKEQYLVNCVLAILRNALPDGPDYSIQEANQHVKSNQNQASNRPGLSSPVADPKASLYANLKLDKETDGGFIRLLRLLPGSSGPIQASMFCVTSPKDRSYEALSYVWGTPTADKIAITVNGEQTEVSTNLHDALLSLRLTDQPRTIWADALCINQNDEDEKAAQVMMMGAIYRQAETVLVFLGMPSPESYLFFDFLDRGPEHEDITQANVEDLIHACGMEDIALFTSFVEFCHREWWTRLWVVQEYFLSKNDPRWYIGSRYILGSKLCRDLLPLGHTAIRLFGPLSQAQDVTYGHDDLTIGQFGAVMNRLSHLIYSRSKPHFYTSPRRLFTRLDRLASNPRDYIYGVLELLEANFRQVFVPDYTLSVSRLFERLAAWLLIMDGWGDMLWWYPHRLAPNTGTASWVPDFTRRMEPESSEPKTPSLSSLIEYRPKFVQCAIVDRILYIEGRQLDVVKEVFRMPEGDSFQVLQQVWKLDRRYCSKQCQDAALTVNSERCPILEWSSSYRPATVPLVPRWTGLVQVLEDELQLHMAKLVGELNRISFHPAVSVLLGPGILRQQDNLGKLGRFLRGEMEADFVSACVYDFDNLELQLQSLSKALPDTRKGTKSTLPHLCQEFHPGICYQDLANIINECSKNEREFHTLLSITIEASRKIQEFAHAPMSHFDVPSTLKRNIAHIEEGVTKLKRQLDKTREVASGSAIVAASVRIEVTTPDMMRLETDIQYWEKKLDQLKRDLPNALGVLCREDKSWGRFNESMAAMYRGREFFRTGNGLMGLGGPGVRGIGAGDVVVLLDGLSLPLVARPQGNLHHLLVGCAHLRGVKLGNTCEDAEGPEGCNMGSKKMFLFV